jgi:hypothetical protein
MIIRFKIYEEMKMYDEPEPEVSLTKPEEGDYVIVTENDHRNAKLNNFLKNNIGQIVKIEKDGELDSVSYYIQFQKVPEDLQYFFEYGSSSFFVITGIKIKNTRIFVKNEILFYSKNREDCEIFLTAKRYNL